MKTEERMVRLRGGIIFKETRSNLTPSGILQIADNDLGERVALTHRQAKALYNFLADIFDKPSQSDVVLSSPRKSRKED